ncbi:MAG: metal ABC transporter ATP-binding protein [Pseudomonadales bacterium]|nr:metal ABC transporter ATP-binding protein [Pseudomonadales bacterium]
MSNDAILEVANLCVSLDGVTLLEDVSFSLASDEAVTILGPNGAGKTVLLRALLGALPYSGKVSWAPGVRFGYVPQRLPYIKDLPVTVADFFALKSTALDEMEVVLAEVGLPAGFSNKRMGELSSGQFQRVLIAWALCSEPAVLLFDEPTTGVDVTGEETIYGLLSRVQRERHLAMLLVTHDLAVVHQLSTRVLCLNRRLVCEGPPIDILTPERLREIYGTEVKYYHHEHGDG